MNVTTIEMARQEARKHFQEYRQAVKETKRKEDVALMRGYRALANGQTLIDVGQAISGAGVNERGQPRLAICRADATHCLAEITSRGAVRFYMDENYRWARTLKARKVIFPNGTYKDVKEWHGKAVVPSIPPRLRPKVEYSKLHILWEAEWEAVPTDPMLLRHLDGSLYVVLAVWDLTALERAVLKRAL